ncbi:hypothetical protein SLEP1_g6264 [Rubroshorea leprosula]|uniref:60S ribosomal protein L18a-like protein n=1 Tax=Rubroshorea leprosula TaxID=152421 RepID=A0AAV5HUX7_9ROSI|nr:hypothetical protein SLEP1_g6264 [Rubroshorea leprosula]
MSGEWKNVVPRGDPRSQYHYGTFQGVANYYPPFPQPLPQPVVGFPRPVVPSGSASTSVPFHGYQTVSGYPIPEDTFVIEHRLPFCGLGMGWLLFFLGFFFGGIPWYLGTFILLCVRVDYREKPGYVACAIASILAMIAVTFGVTKGAHAW